MARASASLAISEPEFDEAWPVELELPVRSVPRLAAAPDVDDAGPSQAAIPRGTAVPGRRTVTIRGQVAARPAPRRARRDPYDRVGSRPDRIAMWAVVLCVLLILVAATSSHAAVLHLALHARP
jgi:hypothetical protein